MADHANTICQSPWVFRRIELPRLLTGLRRKLTDHVFICVSEDITAVAKKIRTVYRLTSSDTVAACFVSFIPRRVE